MSEPLFHGDRKDDVVQLESVERGLYVFVAKHDGIAHPDMAGVVLPADEARRMAHAILEMTA